MLLNAETLSTCFSTLVLAKNWKECAKTSRFWCFIVIESIIWIMAMAALGGDDAQLAAASVGLVAVAETVAFAERLFWLEMWIGVEVEMQVRDNSTQHCCTACWSNWCLLLKIYFHAGLILGALIGLSAGAAALATAPAVVALIVDIVVFAVDFMLSLYWESAYPAAYRDVSASNFFFVSFAILGLVLLNVLALAFLVIAAAAEDGDEAKFVLLEVILKLCATLSIMYCALFSPCYAGLALTIIMNLRHAIFGFLEPALVAKRGQNQEGTIEAPPEASQAAFQVQNSVRVVKVTAPDLRGMGNAPGV